MDNKPHLTGTAFLVASKKYSYLISAAHVLDPMVENKELFFYIEPRLTRKITGKTLRTKIPNGLSRMDDKLDIGVVRLEGAGLPPYPAVEKRCAPIGWLKPDVTPREKKQYLMTGYPSSRSKTKIAEKDLSCEMYNFRGVSAEASTYERMNIDTSHHIAVSFDKKRTRIPGGTVREFPNPAGLSGSPLWLLYDENHQGSLEDIPISGVIIEHHRNEKVLLATDISIVLNMINELEDS